MTSVGAFEIGELLARGSIGTVYRAVQTGPLDRSVAVKTLARNEPAAAIAFQRERTLLAAIHHTHIISLIDPGVEGELTPYFVMELAGGGDVLSYCQRERVSFVGKLRLFQQLVSAVAYLHRNGICHGDLCPDNIHIANRSERDHVKVIDFSKGLVATGPEPFEDDAEWRATARADLANLATLLHTLVGSVADPVVGACGPGGSIDNVPTLERELHKLVENTERAVARRRVVTRYCTLSLVVCLIVLTVALGVTSARPDQESPALEDLPLTDSRALKAAELSLVAAKAEADDLYPLGHDLIQRGEGWLQTHARPLEWLHARLQKHPRETGSDMAQLLRRLDEFLDPDPRVGLAAQMEQRIEDSRQVLALTVTAPEARLAWDDARTRIAASPHYGGLCLPVQEGLLPLGPNTAGLWEFWLVTSGDRPVRATDQQGAVDWVLEGHTGIVLVLIPGGEFTLGAVRALAASTEEHRLGLRVLSQPAGYGLLDDLVEAEDILTRCNGTALYHHADLRDALLALRPGLDSIEIEGTRADGPLRLTLPMPNVNLCKRANEKGGCYPVRLAPYFLGKHEVTLGQWKQAFPAAFEELLAHLAWRDQLQGHDSDLVQPVRVVTRRDALTFTTRLGLLLPTNAQWERAYRAGSRGDWPWGTRPEDGHGNLAGVGPADNFVRHCPVDAFPANAFGLYGMCGNVLEMCLDRRSIGDDGPAHAGDGYIEGTDSRFVTRGSSFGRGVEDARSCWRLGHRSEKTQGNGLGFRVARPIVEREVPR